MKIDKEKSQRICCSRPKQFRIIYDGGTSGDLIVSFCKKCFQNEPDFKLFIKKKVKL